MADVQSKQEGSVKKHKPENSSFEKWRELDKVSAWMSLGNSVKQFKADIQSSHNSTLSNRTFKEALALALGNPFEANGSEKMSNRSINEFDKGFDDGFLGIPLEKYYQCIKPIRENPNGRLSEECEKIILMCMAAGFNVEDDLSDDEKDTN